LTRSFPESFLKNTQTWPQSAGRPGLNYKAVNLKIIPLAQMPKQIFFAQKKPYRLYIF
jgi:hypothetical protein